jgi:hypothetical protein
MDYGKILEYAGRISVGVLLLIILWAGSAGYWVFGSQYKDVVADRDVWKELALKATQVAERTTVKLGGNEVPLPSLTKSASPADVEDRLATLNSRVKYMTEPAEETQK